MHASRLILAVFILALAACGNVQAEHPTRMNRFLINGAAHTTLSDDGFYTNSLDGITVADWTRDFLTDSPSWTDLVDDPLD